jgi:hypothetical protein
MSKAPLLPSITDDLTPTPRARLDLKTLKPREPMHDDAVEANSRAIGVKWGATTQIRDAETEAPTVPPTPLTSIRGYIPKYLDDDLSVKAAERRVTKTFLIMEALHKAGYRVEEIDLVQDRRRSGQKSKV